MSRGGRRRDRASPRAPQWPAGTIDSWAEVVASGLRAPGQGLLVYGTSMFLIEVDSPAQTDSRLWRTVGFTPGSLNVAAGVASGGALTAWLRELTGGVSYSELYAEAAAAGPGAGGLLALPYFAGERTPLFDPDLRGVILGLTAAHGRGHLFRALMEAAAFAVRQNLETMARPAATIAALRSAGAGPRARCGRGSSATSPGCRRTCAKVPARRASGPRCSRRRPSARRRRRRCGRS